MPYSLSVKELIPKLDRTLVVDVRSPSEFAHAHVPGALSLPLFTDAQRAEIGTLYKQRGKEKAMLHALDCYSPNMKSIIAGLQEALKESDKQNGHVKDVVVHCWRGGMRSGVVCWMLELFGYDVGKLDGGYKTFRRWALEQFEKNNPVAIVGGRTGAAKTEVIKALQRNNECAIDLEGLAKHNGSSFGAIGHQGLVTHEQFENELACALFQSNGRTIWLEDESQRIGAVNIPNTLWQQMRGATVYYLDVPLELRLQHLVNTYGKLPITSLVEATVRIRKKLGGLQMQHAIDHFDNKNIAEAFRILLNYYDKAYDEAAAKRDPKTIVRIPTDTLDAERNAHLILQVTKA